MLEQSMIMSESMDPHVNEGLFVSLIDVLTKELLIYTELRDFLINERKGLSTLTSIDGINEHNIMKENIILKSKILQEVRTNIVKKIAKNFDFEENEVKLLTLLGYATEEKRKTIEQIKIDLMNIVRDVVKLNNENKNILNASSYNVNELLEYLSSLTSQSIIYQINGKFDQILSKGRLLHREG